MGVQFQADIILRNGDMSDFDANKIKKGEPAVATDEGRLFVGMGDGEAVEFASVGQLSGEISGIAGEISTINDAVKDTAESLQIKAAENAAAIDRLDAQLAAANPNGEPRVSVTSAAPSVQLPKNAAQSGCETAIRGNTLTNLAINGNFANGTAEWSAVSSDTYTYIEVVGGDLWITDGEAGRFNVTYSYDASNVSLYDYVYFSFRYRLITAAYGKVALLNNPSGDNLDTSENWATYSVRARYTGDNLGSVSFNALGSSDPAEMYIDGEYGIRIINLTKHGLEHLTTEQLDYMTSLYFDGTKSVVAPRLRSVGKNLFDKSRAIRGQRVSSSTGTTSADASRFLYPFFRVKPNTTYSFSHTTRCALYDDKKTYVAGHLSAPNVTTTSTTAYLQLDNPLTSIDVYQLERGSATVYEPYRESAQYTEPYILRRTAAGVYDEISGGKFIRRVSDTGAALTTPIVTENVTSGALVSYPGGTIYAEPALADAGVYNDGISVFYTDFPIESLETVKRVDFETGEQMPLDASHAVISPDGKTFTHPDLTDGDIVFFTYFYDYGGVYGENTYSYLDSNHVKQDSVTGTFYRRDWEVVDGQYHIVLKEVQ